MDILPKMKYHNKKIIFNSETHLFFIPLWCLSQKGMVLFMMLPDFSEIRKPIAMVGKFLCKVGGEECIEWDKVCMVYIQEMNQTFREFSNIAKEQSDFFQKLLFEVLKNAELLHPSEENGTCVYRVVPPKEPSVLVESFDHIAPYVYKQNFSDDVTAVAESIPCGTQKESRNTFSVQEIVDKHKRILEQDRRKQAELMKG